MTHGDFLIRDGALGTVFRGGELWILISPHSGKRRLTHRKSERHALARGRHRSLQVHRQAAGANDVHRPQIPRLG